MFEDIVLGCEWYNFLWIVECSEVEVIDLGDFGLI